MKQLIKQENIGGTASSYTSDCFVLTLFSPTRSTLVRLRGEEKGILHYSQRFCTGTHKARMKQLIKQEKEAVLYSFLYFCFLAFNFIASAKKEEEIFFDGVKNHLDDVENFLHAFFHSYNSFAFFNNIIISLKIRCVKV